jgi:hypothetical protein
MLLESQNAMKSKIFILFILSGLIIIGTIVLAFFWDIFGLTENYIPLAMATTVAFGISITGLMLGVAEKRRSLTVNTWIGIIGNLIVVGFFVFIVLYSFAT